MACFSEPGTLFSPFLWGSCRGTICGSAAAGFLITGVGLPLLGVAALGISREDGLMGVSSRVGRRYGKFFTCILYLTIGPFFAIPRCATVAYTVGVERIIPDSMQTAVLAVFSLLFVFAAVLFFSLRPGEILTWIGKVLNPLFLALSGAFGYPGTAFPRWGVFPGRHRRVLMLRGHSIRDFSKVIIQWMRWQGLLLGLSW